MTPYISPIAPHRRTPGRLLRVVRRAVLAPALLALLTASGPATLSRAQEMSFVDAVGGSGFIFIGTVKSLAAPPASAKAGFTAAVVVVDRVLEALPPVGNPTGQEVTVRLRPGAGLSPGERAAFFTYVQSAGATLDLVAVWTAPPDDPESLLQRIREARATLADQALTARLASARRVVVGTVAKTEPTEGARRPVSEHDPRWWRAAIDVSSTEKGRAPSEGAAVVYFASSQDVVWQDAPKLAVGDRAVFLLQPESGRPGLEAGYRVEGPFVASPLDVLPTEELPRVRRLLEQLGQPR